MAIRIRNVGQKSLLRVYDMTFNTSGLSSVGGVLNVGVVPIACRLKDLFAGTTASAIPYVITVKVNNVDISNAFSVPALAASGGAQRVAAPASPKLITAGSLISFITTSTAATAMIVGTVRFEVDKSEK